MATDMFLSRTLGWWNIRIVAGITVLSLFLLAGGAAADTYSQRTFAPGDLILRADRILIALWDSDVPDVGDAAIYCAKNVISLKEGYTLTLDGVYQENIPATDSTPERSIRIANFSLYRNGENAKKANVTDGEFFYYNMTADGREYNVIEFRVYAIYHADGVYCSGWLVQLKPFNQYSDGAGVIRLNLTDSPVHLPPSEEWNSTFGKMNDDALMSVQQSADGGYFLARSFPAQWMKMSGTSIWLNRTDADGNELWNLS